MPMPGVRVGSKADRQYRHIKSSYKKQSRLEDRAEQLAAMTVNKERRKKGQTKAQRS